MRRWILSLWVVLLAGVTARGATGIGFTFGRLQGPADNESAGPVVRQAHWNNVNARCLANGIDFPWSNTPDMMFPNNANRGDNTFGGDFSGTLKDQTRGNQQDSSGTVLATPITLSIHDPGQPWAWTWNGGYGGGRDAGSKSGAVYDQGYWQWGTADQDFGDSTFTFGSIPYEKYHVYVAGTVLKYNGTNITVSGVVFTDVTSATFQLTAPRGSAYVGYPNCPSLSYIQFVKAVPPTLLIVVR